MDNFKTNSHRKIITDFATAIDNRVKKHAKPSKWVIEFRNERKESHEREIVQVPTELLRFRKENGRIASDVMSYEKNHTRLDESDQKSQEILKIFLANKDPETTAELCQSIKHSSQKEPAIITCDGFLINGNRRKLALEKLYEDTSDARFEWMNVVILPDEDDAETGGPPTYKEIAQIESRYQSQVDGKAEYYSFDEALSTRNYIKRGFTLEEKLRDDPRYVDKSEDEFKREIKKFTEEYLNPLDCVDEYLEYLGREGLYTNISSGRGDREGRWEAFKDYSKIRKKLNNENTRININIEEEEIGDLISVIHKLIRIRELPGRKLHQTMRELPKWLKIDDSKKELFKLINVEDDIPEDQKCDKNGAEIDDIVKDRIWIQRNKSEITCQVKKAAQLFEKNKERETPIELLEAALKKLYHEDLLPENIEVNSADEAVKILNQIKQRAKELGSTFFKIGKGVERLKGKFNNK